MSGKLCFCFFNQSISQYAEKLARKQILQIMNQLNHSDMNFSCLILKESLTEISFKACASNDFFIKLWKLPLKIFLFIKNIKKPF